MATKMFDRKQPISFNELLGCLSYGANKRGIFLKLCQAFKDLNLDIIDVDSHVRQGWFAKMIIARNKNTGGLPFNQFESKIRTVSRNLQFEAKCFVVPEKEESPPLVGGVVIVVQAENKVGLLADLLDLLNKYNIDIIDIKIEMEKEEKAIAMNIYTYIQAADNDYFNQLENIRGDLHRFKEDNNLSNFSYLIHSMETYRFIHKIDYESSLETEE